MKSILLAGAALAMLASAAAAQRYPGRGPAYPAYAAGRTLPPDEIRDYERDQMDRRHEMERHALRMRQKDERRALGLDD